MQKYQGVQEEMAVEGCQIAFYRMSSASQLREQYNSLWNSLDSTWTSTQHLCYLK